MRYEYDVWKNFSFSGHFITGWRWTLEFEESSLRGLDIKYRSKLAGVMPVSSRQRDSGRKEFKMIVTGIIIVAVAIYTIWAVRKIHRDRKNGSCCGGSCSGCVGKEYCSK